MPPKVSIVVPTYAPGDRIDGLVRSLDAQTMPTSDFEVIFVDDGSPDDTWTRLQSIAATRNNVRLERIPNSGWPSRPRNVGLELARGEYVLFMDHDDELYPRALAAGYAMAARTQADVLNGKETRTDQSAWALDVYTANIDNAIDRTDVHPLIPTNPHKLFRRELLMSHGIRFPEGRRVLWEDVFFCLDVARHATVVSVMADTPFYHWIRRTKTASSSFGDNPVEFWTALRDVITQCNELLSGPDLARQRKLMLSWQYRFRVLARLEPSLFRRAPAELASVRAIIADIVLNSIPLELDAELPPVLLGRATLVRQNRWDLLARYVDIDFDVTGLSTATSTRWVDGRMHIVAETRWRDASGGSFALAATDGRILRGLPDDIAAALPTAAVDVSDAVELAGTKLGIRARASGVTWLLGTTSQSRLDMVDGRPELVVTARAAIDPRTAAFGRPLDEASWEVVARNEVLGRLNQRRLRTTIKARAAIGGGHVYVAYSNKAGMLTLDVDETHRSLVGSARLDPARLSSSAERTNRRASRRSPEQFRVSCLLPFTGVATNDESQVSGSVSLGGHGPFPARIVVADGDAWLEFAATLAPGRYPLRLGFHDRDMDSALDAIVAIDGGLSMLNRDAAPPAVGVPPPAAPGGRFQRGAISGRRRAAAARELLSQQLAVRKASPAGEALSRHVAGTGRAATGRPVTGEVSDADASVLVEARAPGRLRRQSDPDTPLVSVVVATYCPGEGLDRLVHSIDRQTLPQSDFEFIYVDDGSPDDTWEHLQAIKSTRPNVIVERIPNSGWPSRPRNIGTDIARGEFVFFMDHDDQIFPDGLRAATTFGIENNLDIVSVKEVKTSSPGFGFDAYRADSAGPRAELGIMNLVPMMPHKLYRRQMLIDHSIRFPEGRRLLWEDVYYNVDAFAAASRIGTMADTAVYRRIMSKSNASNSYRPQFEEFWQKFLPVLAHIESMLHGDEFTLDRSAVIVHQYVTRVLNSVTALLANGHEDGFAIAMPYIREIHRRWLPREAVASLPTRYARVDDLLRAEDVDGLRELAIHSAAVVGLSATTNVSWQDGTLMVAASAAWTSGSSPLAPGFLAPTNAGQLSRVEADLATAASVLVLHDRNSKESTGIETTSSIRQSNTTKPLGVLAVAASALIRDFSGPAAVYDVQARNSALGFVNQRGLRTAIRALVGLIDGQAVIAYANQRGVLSLDRGQRVRSVINSARRDYGAAELSRTVAGHVSFSLPLGDVHVWGRTRLTGRVRLTPHSAADVPPGLAQKAQTSDAFLIGDERGARLELAVLTGPGQFLLAFDFNGSFVASDIVLTVSAGDDGKATLAPA